MVWQKSLGAKPGIQKQVGCHLITCQLQDFIQTPPRRSHQIAGNLKAKAILGNVLRSDKQPQQTAGTKEKRTSMPKHKKHKETRAEATTIGHNRSPKIRVVSCCIICQYQEYPTKQSEIWQNISKYGKICVTGSMMHIWAHDLYSHGNLLLWNFAAEFISPKNHWSDGLSLMQVPLSPAHWMQKWPSGTGTWFGIESLDVWGGLNVTQMIKSKQPEHFKNHQNRNFTKIAMHQMLHFLDHCWSLLAWR